MQAPTVVAVELNSELQVHVSVFIGFLGHFEWIVLLVSLFLLGNLLLLEQLLLFLLQSLLALVECVIVLEVEQGLQGCASLL